MRLLLHRALVASVAAVALSACDKADRAIWTDKDEPHMIAAIQAARAALPIFWAKVDAHEPDVTETLVKVGYPTGHGGIEYLWMDVASHDASNVRGRILNEPEDVAGVHAGQDVALAQSTIGDWAYRKAGKYYGQFTTRVLLETADSATRREQSADLAPTPLEPTAH
jgi:uncharacterized protein YegJ (DUF2314 family)